MRRSLIGSVVLLLAVAFPHATAAASDGPLAALGALVVGTWEAEDTRHEFEWGVGQKAIRSRSYFKQGDGWKLVGEGLWFWDAAEDTVRGVAVAVGMPVELFEYRSEVRGDEVVHDLVAHGSAGGRFVERWSFSPGTYRWSLETEVDGKVVPVMAGEYGRVADEP